MESLDDNLDSGCVKTSGLISWIDDELEEDYLLLSKA